jgi:hypothetical protein
MDPKHTACVAESIFSRSAISPGPTSRDVPNGKVKEPEYHVSADLLEGTDKNYHSLGMDWPANRYLLITLSGDADIKRI